MHGENRHDHDRSRAGAAPSPANPPSPDLTPQARNRSGPGGLQMGMIVIGVLLLAAFVLILFIWRGT